MPGHKREKSTEALRVIKSKERKNFGRLEKCKKYSRAKRGNIIVQACTSKAIKRIWTSVDLIVCAKVFIVCWF